MLPSGHIDYEKHVDENEVKLNNEQLIAYQDILNSVIIKEGKLYFLDGPAGTGKTILINLLLSKLMTKNIPYIAVASSGIAATLRELQLLNTYLSHINALKRRSSEAECTELLYR